MTAERSSSAKKGKNLQLQGNTVLSNLEIGLAIRRRRRELDLSQEELADRLNVTYQQLQRYENGKNCINAENLQYIANALSVPVSYFFSCGTVESAGEFSSLHVSRGERELLTHYRMIDQKEVKTLVVDFTRLAAKGTGVRGQQQQI